LYFISFARLLHVSINILFALFGFLVFILSTQQAFAETSLESNPKSLAPWQYTVKKNDNLHTICKKYCVPQADLHKLAQLNQIKQSDLIHPNQILVIPMHYLRTTQFTAQVLVAHGDVQIKKNGNDVFQALHTTDKVAVGETVKTGVNSIIKLKFADGSTSNLQPNSSLTLLANHQYAGKSNFQVKVHLQSGRAEVSANPQHTEDNQLEVETPTAIAVVRGTEFRVGAEPNKAMEETINGLVGFSSGAQEVHVAEQFGTIAREGEPPLTPQKLPSPIDTQNFTKIFHGAQVRFTIPLQTGFSWVAQLAKDENFNQVLDSITGMGELTLHGLSVGQYFLKLRQQDTQGLQSLDTVHAFEVKEALPKLILIAPLGQSLTGHLNVFSWENFPQHRGYSIQIAKDSAFNEIVLTRHVSFNTFYLQEALPAGQYFWRVRAQFDGKIPAGATADYSESGQFNF
jgi:hypothetical protein